VADDHRKWRLEADRVLDLLGDAADEYGFHLLNDEVQILLSGSIANWASAKPFESGMLAVTPLQPLLLVFERHFPDADDRPFWEHPHAEAVAGFLAGWLGDGDELTVIGADRRETITLSELSRFDTPDYLFVARRDEFTGGDIDPRAMHRIVARLRRPDGCPWDRKQTHQSLARSLVDEVYEAVDAIERGDAGNLAEELGDLFLLILMQAQIAHEAGEFSIEDVYAGISRKIVGRHPHVFGEAVVNTEADLAGIWNDAKAREKADGTKSGGKDIDGEPFSMPALTRASRVLKKHPVTADDDPPELLRVVAEIVARGEDPDAVLRQQLRDHLAITRD
jgi:tetrapyrrole methylase family protein/MazG family protein